MSNSSRPNSSASISRVSAAPNLTEAETKLITELVFFAPPPQKSDVMLIFGAPEGDWSVAAKAYEDGLAPIIVASGGVHERTRGVLEAELIRDALIAHGVPPGVVLTETIANNTLDNVLRFKELLYAQGILPKRILYMTIYHHSGRCYLTLKKQFPNAEITAINHGLLYSGLDIRPQTWRTVEGADARVYGEYTRINTYADKGDIESPKIITRQQVTD